MTDQDNQPQQNTGELFGNTPSDTAPVKPLFGESASPAPGTLPLFGSPASPEHTEELPLEQAAAETESTPVQETAPAESATETTDPVRETAPAESVTETVDPVQETAPAASVTETVDPVQETAVQETVSPVVQEKTIRRSAPARSIVPELKIEDVTPGAFLKDARRISGYTLDEISQSTRIRSYYIEALENDEIGKLPQGSLPFAYIRSICGFYGLDRELTDRVVEKARSVKRTEEPFPETIIEHIGSTGTYNEKEEKKLMKILICGGSVLAVLILGIIGLVIWWFLPSPDKPEVPEETVAEVQTVIPAPENDSELFDKLTAPVVPEVRELAVPGTSARKR